jgi:CHAT domain-containing protein/Tfp pilus assembly protein PilF
MICFFRVGLFVSFVGLCLTNCSRSTHETAPAGLHFKKAQEFAELAQYDSSNFYFDLAGRVYEDSAPKADTTTLWEKLIQCRNGIGENYRNQFRFEAARGLLSATLSLGIEKLQEHHPEVATTHAALAMVYFDTDQYRKAVSHLSRALDLTLPVVGEKHPAVAKIYYGLGTVYWRLQYLDVALDYQLKALNIRREAFGEHHPDVAESCRMVGRVYWYKTDYEAAIQYLTQALTIAKSLWGENHPFIAQVYLNLAANYLNKPDRAGTLEYLQKALAIGLPLWTERHAETANLYYNFGMYHLRKSELDKAYDFLAKSLEIRRQLFGEVHYEIAASHSALGEYFRVRGDYEKSLEHYATTLQINLRVLPADHPWIAARYHRIGEIYLVKGDPDRALRFYQKAVSTLVMGFTENDPHANPKLENFRRDHYHGRESFLRKAEAFNRRYWLNSKDIQDLKSSLSTYQLTADLIEKRQSGYKGDESKIWLAGTVAKIYAGAIQTALQLYEITGNPNYKEQAFLYSERSKSSVLWESLTNAQAQKFAGIPDSVLNREQELKQELARLENQILIERTQAESREEKKPPASQSAFDETHLAYQNLIDHIERTYPEYYTLKYREKNPSISQIQKQLGPHTAVVEYFLGDSLLHIFVLAHDRLDAASIRIDSSFESAIAEMYLGIKKLDNQSFRRRSYELYQKLIAPIYPWIEKKESLVIIPHDKLLYLPFETLLTQPAAADEFSVMPYLIRQFEVSYLYSARFLAENPRALKAPTIDGFVGFAPVFTKKPNHNFLAKVWEALKNYWGNGKINEAQIAPLPETETELRSVCALFKDRGKPAQIFLHEKAREEHLKSSAARAFRFLHLATHTWIKDKDPRHSGLLFFPSNDSTAQEDGILHASEIYNLELQADLVVLSSCENGIGELAKGEGMLALTRSFLYAGAKNILYTLWEVPDHHTSRMMVEFYQQILSDNSYAKSLRAAKLQMIANAETAHPKKWGGFVLLGR